MAIAHQNLLTFERSPIRVSFFSWFLPSQFLPPATAITLLVLVVLSSSMDLDHYLLIIQVIGNIKAVTHHVPLMPVFPVTSR